MPNDSIIIIARNTACIQKAEQKSTDTSDISTMGRVHACIGLGWVESSTPV